MPWFYNIFIIIYGLLIRCASPFNVKASQWVAGRKKIFRQLEKVFPAKQKVAWFHCASLGEFEQGRPVIEGFRRNYPDFKICITFFSPSGYEIRKNYTGADYIFYLPLDTPGNASRFVKLVSPALVFFVKYEFWFNYFKALARRGTPLFVVSVNFRKDQHFFKWYGGWFRKHLRTVKHFFVQKDLSQILLNKINISNVTICGDSRFDRVHQITSGVKSYPLIQRFCEGYEIIIAGSSWPADEALLVKLINEGKTNYKYIIAPHIVDIPHVSGLAEKIKIHAIKYSEADEENVMYAKVLIIDCIGILSHVYQYGNIAYIGGGFGAGIHNILEAATFGLPTIFGPNYKKFPEAIELISKNGAFSISRYTDFADLIMRFKSDRKFLIEASRISREYVRENTGATEKILRGLNNFEKKYGLL